jgi:hypothetical protein
MLGKIVIQNIPTLFWFLFLIIFLGFLYQVFHIKIKGKVGERKVALILSLLNSEAYKVLNNVVLDVDGNTSQIDHIVISDYGLFVIETKNYGGWIFGAENSDYWTQVFFRRKERFYNPIRQNRSHILALKKVLNQFPDLKYVSVIVFSSRATIKVNTKTEVTYPFRILDYIKRYSEINLSRDKKEEIFAVIDLLNTADNYDKKKHIIEIQQKVRKRDEYMSQKKCPRCGNKLVERSGKYGIFLGCSSFPGCKFTSQG